MLPTGMGKSWLLYGAYGTAGKRILASYAARNLPAPLIAGRNEKKLNEVASQFGVESVCFDLSDGDTLRSTLRKVDAALLCAGPFAHTSKAVRTACLETGTHYLDISGEIEVFKQSYADHEKALSSGVVLMPGVGLDIVPSDCVARWLARELPDATHLELAVVQAGSPPSAGTVKTSLEGLAKGNFVFEGAALKQVRLGHKRQTVPFADVPRRCYTVPLADVYSAHWSTQIPNVAVYGALPRTAVWSARMMRPILRTRLGMRFACKLVDWFLPASRPKEHTHSEFWGRASNRDGKQVECTLSCPGGAIVTPQAACDAVANLLASSNLKGALTPGQAFGVEFVERWGTIRRLTTH